MAGLRAGELLTRRERARRRGIVIMGTLVVILPIVGGLWGAYTLSPIIRDWVDDTIFEPVADAIEDALTADE